MAELVTEDVVWADPALPVPRAAWRRSRRSCARLRSPSPTSVRRARPRRPHRRGRPGRLAVADARHDDRPARPAGVRPDGPLHGGRGRRPLDVPRRADRPLPRLLRHERPRAAARAGARAGQRRGEGGGRAAARSRPPEAEARRGTAPAPFDAVIVGASVAGCTAARLYALRGPRVALVERRPDDGRLQDRLHALRPAERDADDRALGLADLLDAHGAVRNSIDLWTPYGGWIRQRQDTPYGYNVTRRASTRCCAR